MDSILDFWSKMVSNPLLFVAVMMTLGVILVNGWTDAPNAIATCVVTRCMSARAAIIMAAVFNFLGVYVMTLLSPKVAETITKMVDFGTNSKEAIVALSAAMWPASCFPVQQMHRAGNTKRAWNTVCRAAAGSPPTRE